MKFQDVVDHIYSYGKQHSATYCTPKFVIAEALKSLPRNLIFENDEQLLSEDSLRIKYKGKKLPDKIIHSQELSENFIRDFKNKLDWDTLSRSIHQKNFSKEFLLEFKDKLNWPVLIESKKVSIRTFFSLNFEFDMKTYRFKEIKDIEDFKVIFRIKTQIETISDYEFVFQYVPISINQNSRFLKEAPEEFFIKYKEHVCAYDCNSIFDVRQFSEETLEILTQAAGPINNQNKAKAVDWQGIAENQKLSESFIRRHLRQWNINTLSHEESCWSKISRHQKLSEPFIREFKHKVDWEEIAQNQSLSESFIKEFLIGK